MVEATVDGVFCVEVNRQGGSQKKREFKITDGTLPLVLMVICRLLVRTKYIVIVVVFNLDDSG